jgi:hypothetical protein
MRTVRPDLRSFRPWPSSAVRRFYPTCLTCSVLADNGRLSDCAGTETSSHPAHLSRARITIWRSWYGAIFGPGSLVNIVNARPLSFVSRHMPAIQKSVSSGLVKTICLLSRVSRIRKCIKAVCGAQAAVRCELSVLGTVIVDRPLVRTCPAPSTLHEIASSRDRSIAPMIGAISVILISSRASR